MKVALIGGGAIGSWLLQRLDPKPHIVRRGDSLPNTDVVVETHYFFRPVPSRKYPRIRLSI